MNRRSFLTRLGLAAASAAALDLVDPEKLLWVPGAKTIIDLGATKHLEAPTDAQVAKLFDTRNGFDDYEYWSKSMDRPNPLDILLACSPRYDLADRDITITIGGQRFGGEPVMFKYKGDRLVSVHSEAELRRLDSPLFGYLKPGNARPRFAPEDFEKETDWSLIDVPEDRES